MMIGKSMVTKKPLALEGKSMLKEGKIMLKEGKSMLKEGLLHNPRLGI